MTSSYGDYYGYPKCCILAFHQMMFENKILKEISPERQQTKKNGFIPCQGCAERVLRGEIQVHELILTTRKCHKPFS